MCELCVCKISTPSNIFVENVCNQIKYKYVNKDDVNMKVMC